MLGFGHLQGLRLQNLVGQPAPVLCHPHIKMLFLKWNFLYLGLCSRLILSLGGTEKSLALSSLSSLSFQIRDIPCSSREDQLDCIAGGAQTSLLVCGNHFEFTTNLFAFGFYQKSGTTYTTEIEIFQSSRKELNCSSLMQIFNVLLFFPTLNLHSQIPI